MLEIPIAMEEALALHRAGNIEAAARIYEAVLAVSPGESDALHLLGLVQQQKNNFSSAIDLIRRSIDSSPRNPVYYGNLGVALRFAGRFEEAIAAYQASLALAPDSPEILFNLGKSLKLNGNLDDAGAAFKRSIELNPKHNAPWLSLMSLYAERGDLPGAIKVGEQAIQSCIRDVELLLNLGVLYKRARRCEQAVTVFRSALDIEPESVDALCKLGSMYIQLHQIEYGGSLLNRAFVLFPENQQVLSGLAQMYSTLGDDQTAIKMYRRAIELFSHDANLVFGLASPLKKLGRLSEAFEALNDGLRRDAKHVEGWVKLGIVQMSLGDFQDSVRSFRRALELRPDYTEAMDGKLLCIQYSPDSTAESIKEAHRAWDGVHRRQPVRQSGALPVVRSKKLRLGFVSADLGCHPVGFFTVQMFEHLDRQVFDTFVFSDRLGCDSITSRIQATVTAWHNTKPLGDERLARLIRDLNIDILFDLAGHTAGNRLRIFALRAAPVQVTWAGYVGTSGLAEMDYLLADSIHVPPGDAHHHWEKTICMPNGYVCFDPPQDAPDVSELPALRRRSVLLAAVANPAKINGPLLEVWREILRSIPASRLLLCYNGWGDRANQERVRRALEEHADRVEFDQCPERNEVLEKYQQVDIALDTFPYSGGLTTCEALWMGVPTVTMTGERFASRHSTSHLMNAGYSDLITTCERDYIDRVIGLAADLEELSRIRRSMRLKVANSLLCDGPGFADDFGRLMIELRADNAA